MAQETVRQQTTLGLPSEFRTLVEDLRAILWEIDHVARRFTWVSRHAEEVLGYPVSDWLDETGFWENHIHPQDRESVLETCARVVREGQDHQLEYRMIAANGRIVWLRQIVRTVKDEQGSITKLRGVMVDITDRRDAELALRESEERFRKLFQDGPIGMIIVGMDLRILAVNQAFCAMLGMEEQQLIGTTASQFIHPDDRRKCADLIDQLFSGRIANYKIQKRYVNARGEIVWVDVFRTLLRDEGGNPRYSMGVAADVTEHKRNEEALRELSARLMRLQEEEHRRIARELHDSTGQNLAALKLNLSRLGCAQLKPELSSLVTDSLQLTDRMLGEIRNLSHLLHPPLLEELGLALAVRAYADGFRNRSGIAVHLEIPENLGRLTPNLETAIFRIIQEGLTNTYRHSGGTECSITINSDGQTLRLRLRDNGRGLRPEARADLERGGGLGVGLSGMRERARQLQGCLDIESAASGCTIMAVFPLR